MDECSAISMENVNIIKEEHFAVPSDHLFVVDLADLERISEERRKDPNRRERVKRIAEEFNKNCTKEY